MLKTRCGLVAALAVSLVPSAGEAQSRPPRDTAEATTAKAPVAAPPLRYRPNRIAARARKYYQLVWGVDSLSVKLAESGEVVRFAWRVVDPDKAKVLSDKRLKPALVDPQAGVSLVVPEMENIGQLRQSAPPVAGKSYWMVFSNKGRLVKRGDRVSVVIGEFRAEGLGVD